MVSSTFSFLGKKVAGYVENKTSPPARNTLVVLFLINLESQKESGRRANPTRPAEPIFPFSSQPFGTGGQCQLAVFSAAEDRELYDYGDEGAPKKSEGDSIRWSIFPFIP